MQNGVRHTNAVERELSSLSPNSFSFLKLSDPGKEGGVAAVCDMLQSIDTEILSLLRTLPPLSPSLSILRLS